MPRADDETVVAYGPFDAPFENATTVSSRLTVRDDLEVNKNVTLRQVVQAR